MVVGEKNDKVFLTVLYIVLTLLAIITLYPFLNVLALSFNDAMDSVKGGITIFPRHFTTLNYKQVLESDNLVTGFRNSALRTIIDTGIGVLVSAMLAFTFSRKDFMARKLYSIIFLLTMYISGGLIPGYMLIRDLHLMNNFLVYVIPSLTAMWNIMIIRSFIDGLPYSLQESAMIDGAGDFTIFYKIILPLCTPVLATVALFIAVGQWNAWFDTYLYCQDKPSLTTLQFELQKILQSVQASMPSSNQEARTMLQNNAITPESIKMAITIVCTVPILIVYPFVQKYFVQGMTLGAVKS